jgi:hypothetical protein
MSRLFKGYTEWVSFVSGKMKHGTFGPFALMSSCRGPEGNDPELDEVPASGSFVML